MNPEKMSQSIEGDTSYGRIENDGLDNPPEGFQTIKEISETSGLSRKQLLRRIGNLGLQLSELPQYKTGTGKGTRYASFLSPEQQKSILSEEESPEGYSRLDALSSELGFSSNKTVSRIMKTLELEPLVLGRGGTQYITSEQRQAIMNYIVPPEGYVEVDDFINSIGIGKSFAREKFKELNYDFRTFNGKTKKRTQYISPEQQESFLKEIKIEAPEGYKTVKEFAELLGLGSTSPIYDLVKKYSFSLEIYGVKVGGGDGYLSPEQQSVIEKDFEAAPENYEDAITLAGEIGISENQLYNQIRDLKIDLPLYKGNGGRLTRYFSPEQRQAILNYNAARMKAEEIPEGYITAQDFADELGSTSTTIFKYADMIGVPIIKYKTKMNYVAVAFSPNQKAEIAEAMEHTLTSTSIPENTVAYYIQQKGGRIKRGIRPDWLKNPETGKNLEIDIFLDPPGVGIEYDGAYFHKNPERDSMKDELALSNGVRIIHLREAGCPELPEQSLCIQRKDNRSEDDLTEAIKKCLSLLGFSIDNVDVRKDKDKVMEYIRERINNSIEATNSATELEVA